MKKILIAARSKAEVEMLINSLSIAEHTEIIIRDRLEAIIKDSDQNKPDLVFLDLELADGKGLDSFHRLNDLMPDVPIIITSNTNNREMAMLVLNAGAQDYIVNGEYDQAALTNSIRYSIGRKASQVKLKESEEQYRALVENAPEALVVYDLDTGKFTNVSESATVLFKLPKEELLKLGPMDLSPERQPDGRLSSDSAIEKLNLAMSGSKPHFEWTHMDAQGNKIPCEVWLVRLPAGNSKLIRGSIIDITERKKAEEAMRAAEQTRKLIMNSAIDGIICIDTNGIIITWTPQVEKVFGWKESEVIGKAMADIIIPVGLRSRHREGFERYKSTREARILNRMVEVTALHKEGHEFPIELTIAEIKDSNNPFFCAFIRDITERLKAKEQIEKEKKLSDNIIQSLPGLFYLFDENGYYIRWNKQKETISGYSFSEIQKMKPAAFFSKEDHDKISRHIRQGFEKGETKLEAELLTKSGKKIPFYFTGIAVEYEGKKCLLGTGIDISDRKKAENLLKQSTEQLRELSTHLQNVREFERMEIAREIHDELGQQLTVLKMDIAWLQQKIVDPPPKVAQKMDDLMQVVDHTVMTVRKISSNLRPSMLDDLGLVPSLEWHSQEFQKRSGIITHFESETGEMKIGSPVTTAMFRIFQESLTNVARHAGATEVRASLRVENGKLVMRIADNGKGFSIHGIQDKKTLGILGMKERVSMLKGEYSLDSQPGSGTTVEVKLPVELIG